ncbi:hypothetical protein FSP39_006603, partial [Pinctada imbricata]
SFSLKEAIAIVVDIGPSMNNAPPGEDTPLQTALDAITMIVQRKMFSESKDELALVLCGSPGTDNPLADGQSYENITIARPMAPADFEFLQQVQTDITPSNVSADFIDALVVAMDHLVNATQGKKGFGFKRLILLSDLGGEFGDDGIDTIVAGIKNTGTELNVIGPDLEDDDEDSEKPGPSGTANGHRKEKTSQQRAGEAMIRHILQEVEGECYSFSEALPALSYFQMRQVRPTAWKANLQITPDLVIPICSYIKLKDFKTKSWKKVYAKDPEEGIVTSRTFHMNDEEETELDKEDVVEGHRYGNTLVPMSADDKENMKYRSEKCFKVLGFTKSENIKRHHQLGDGASFVVADKGDESASVALSSIINALYETNMVAIVRKVYSAASGPKLGCLMPHIKSDYECLVYVELPFREDVRQFTFGSLPIKDDDQTNKKFKPSDEQLDAIDDLISNTDLSTAAEDEEGEKSESLKPKLIFNPHFQRLYQCLQHRAFNPDDALPELSPLIANSLKPPQEVAANCEQQCEKVKKLFKLEVVKKKEDKTGESMFKSNEEEPASKKLKVDDDLEGGLADITKAKVTEVGTVTPVEDFIALISQKDVDNFSEACKQMEKRVEQLVLDSFGAQFYAKAMDCLKALREQAIKKSEPKIYNTFIKTFKDTLISKGRRSFWEQIVDEKQSLISKLESEDSDVGKEEAEGFNKEEEASQEEEEKAEEADDADDLETVNEAFKNGSRDFNINVKSILCCIVFNPEWSDEVAELCQKYRSDGVVGIDMACGEMTGKETNENPHKQAFQKAYRYGIHRTVHAGESGPAEAVREAVDDMHAERIGHGYHVMDDEDLYQRLRKSRVHFEVCPLSSVRTGAVTEDLNKHPLHRFIDDGVNFSINSDDPVVLDNDLSVDYNMVMDMGMSEDAIIKCIFNAARSCFAPEKEKKDLLDLLINEYGEH